MVKHGYYGKKVRLHQRNKAANLMKFDYGGRFSKEYNNSWHFLLREFSPLEVSAVSYLIAMAKMNTGSLEPLDDNTTVKELTFKLNISKNNVNKVLKKLFLYGVYGRFEVYDPNKPYTKYWIINPFLSFAGIYIDTDIVNLFKGTYVAQAYFDPNFVFQKTKRNEHLVPKMGQNKH